MSEWHDDNSDDFDEDCDADYGDDGSDDETLTVPCPDCGLDVYEDAEHCPACGAYIVHATSPWSGKPMAWIVLGLAGIFAVIVVLGIVH